MPRQTLWIISVLAPWATIIAFLTTCTATQVATEGTSFGLPVALIIGVVAAIATWFGLHAVGRRDEPE